MNSNNFFQLVAEFQKNIDWLNLILVGGDTDSVNIGGTVKPSISKDVAEKWAAIRAMVDGRSTYETLAELPAGGPPQNPDGTYPLAEVWNDPVEAKNGVYGWNGAWVKAAFDSYEEISAQLDARESELHYLLANDNSPGLSVYPDNMSMFGDNDDGTMTEVAMAITDEDGETAVAIEPDGRVRVFTAMEFLRALHLVKDASGSVGFSLGKNAPVLFGISAYGELLVGDTIVSATPDGSDIEYGITDENGQLAIAVNKRGQVQVTTAQFEAVQQFAYAIADENGQVALSINSAGEVDFQPSAGLLEKLVSKPVVITDSVRQPAELTDITHVQIHGQSLSIGSGAADISGESTQGVLMPDSGVYDSALTGSGIDGMDGPPPISTGFALMDMSYGAEGKEVPIAGICEQLQFMLDTHHGKKVTTVFGSASGHGGFPIRYLDKEGDPSRGEPSPNYELMRDQQKHYVSMASEQRSEHLTTQALCWVQGETDISQGTSKDEYKRRLKNLLYDFASDTQPNYMPALLTYQTGSHTKRYPNREPDIPIGQWELSKEDPNIFLGCVMYPIPHGSDGVHLTSHGSRWMGAYLGKATFEVLTKGQHNPLQPRKVMRGGKVVTVKFDVPTPPLVWDTTQVTNPGDYGFEVWDGSKKIAIDSINIAGDDSVKIVLSSEPTGDVEVRYAMGTPGQPGGPTTGPRGNLRDSDPASCYFSAEPGYNYTLHNWCVIFKMSEGE